MSNKSVKILVLRANPINTDQLRLDEEVRGIQSELERARYRDRFEFFNEGAVRVDDLSRALLKHKPDIVHFSGHGAGEQGLALEDDAGKMQLVSTEALSRLFKWARNTVKVKCVFLNACYSKVQAEAIHQNIDCVIGMNQAIGDRAAILFAAKFYQALVDGESFQSAYEYACTVLDLSGSKESSTPELLNRNEGKDPLAIATPDATQIQQSQVAEPLPHPSAQPSSRSNNISVGGSVTGSNVFSGDNNTASVTFQQASLSEPASVDIQSELQALRDILAQLNDPVVDGVFKKIDDEAKKPTPDKSVIGTTLETGLTYAKNLQGFAEAIDKLRPHVQKTASWLGQNWYKLLPLVGLAI